MGIVILILIAISVLIVFKMKVLDVEPTKDEILNFITEKNSILSYTQETNKVPDGFHFIDNKVMKCLGDNYKYDPNDENRYDLCTFGTYEVKDNIITITLDKSISMSKNSQFYYINYSTSQIKGAKEKIETITLTIKKLKNSYLELENKEKIYKINNINQDYINMVESLKDVSAHENIILNPYKRATIDYYNISEGNITYNSKEEYEEKVNNHYKEIKWIDNSNTRTKIETEEQMTSLANYLGTIASRGFSTNHENILELDPEYILEITIIKPNELACTNKETAKEKIKNYYNIELTFEPYRWISGITTVDNHYCIGGEGFLGGSGNIPYLVDTTLETENDTYTYTLKAVGAIPDAPLLTKKSLEDMYQVKKWSFEMV